MPSGSKRVKGDAESGPRRLVRPALGGVRQIGDVSRLESYEEFGGRAFPVAFSLAKEATARARVSGQSAMRMCDSAIPNADAAAMDH